MSYSGTALLVLALGSAIWAQMDGVTSLSLLLIFAVLSLCWLAAALAVAENRAAGQLGIAGRWVAVLVSGVAGRVAVVPEAGVIASGRRAGADGGVGLGDGGRLPLVWHGGSWMPANGCCGR